MFSSFNSVTLNLSGTVTLGVGVSGGGPTPPTTWTVLNSLGTPYSCPFTVLDSTGASYLCPVTVYDSSGNPVTPI